MRQPATSAPVADDEKTVEPKLIQLRVTAEANAIAAATAEDREEKAYAHKMRPTKFNLKDWCVHTEVDHTSLNASILPDESEYTHFIHDEWDGSPPEKSGYAVNHIMYFDTTTKPDPMWVVKDGLTSELILQNPRGWFRKGWVNKHGKPVDFSPKVDS